MQKHWKLFAQVLIVFSVLLFIPANPAQAAVNCSDPGVECVSGDLAGNETWTSANIYVITADLTIPAGVTLTIETGTIIKFNAYHIELFVDGILNANGTSGDRIYFTSVNDDLGGDTNHDTTPPAANQWGRVYFRGGSSGTLNYVEMRYGGYHGGLLYTDASTNVAVDHGVFANSGNCAINSDPGYEPTLTNMSPTDFTGSVYNGICIRALGISNNTTWDETEAAYILYDDITVTSGFTLNLGPGVVIKPRAYYVELFVDGTLNANGTSGERVYFTSINDDSVGGQTNNNANPPAVNEWGRVYFRGGSSGTLNYVEMRYGGYLGGFLYTDANTNVAVDHGVFANSGNCAISSDPGYEPTLTNMSPTDFTGSVYNGICMRALGISNNTTWDETEAAYILYDDITVTSGFTLNLGPGVVIKPRNYHVELFVDGTLNANGTAGDRVYFTSINDDSVGGQTNNNANPPAVNEWGRVYFRGGSSGTLNYVEMRYGGYLGGFLYTDANTNVAVDHGVFANSGNCAISSDPGYEPTLTNMSPTDFTGSVYNGICIRALGISNNTTWDETEAAYILYDDITVTSGFTLNLGPGVVIKPRNYHVELFVDGTLNANGAVGERVYFTSINDDSVGGQTNNNANPPAVNEWGRVYFRGGSSGTLNYVEMRYGGYLGGFLYTDANTNVAIDHGVFANSGNCAISSDPGYEPTLTNMSPTDFTGSVYNGICIRALGISNNTTWDETEAAYILYDDITVTSGFTLNLGPGVVIKPRNYHVELFVDGTLNANGAMGERVYFTSINDDSVGGQTNNNANPPAVNEWGRVHYRLNSGGTLILSKCDMVAAQVIIGLLFM